MIGYLILLVVAAIVALTVKSKPNSNRRNLTGPVCGHCGYSVIGLTSLTCPECGGDLRTIGIVTPRTPQPSGVAGGVMIFTLLLGLIAVVATSGVESLVPIRHSYRQQIRLGPLSNTYADVLVDTSHTTWGGSITPATVTVELEPASAASALPAQMTVHPDGQYEFTTAGSKVLGRGEFGKTAVLEWLKAAGVDTSDPDMQRKAARIAAEVRIAARSGRASVEGMRGIGSSSGSSSSGDPARVFESRSTREIVGSSAPVAPMIAMLLFWLSVWLWGLWYLITRGTRRQRANPSALLEAAPT